MSKSVEKRLFHSSPEYRKLYEENFLLTARVDGLRGVLQKISDSEHTGIKSTLTLNHYEIYRLVDKALAATGTDHLRKQLEEVEKDLGLWKTHQYKFNNNFMHDCYECIDCGTHKNCACPETCELSNQIVELEKKRDALMELLGRVG